MKTIAAICMLCLGGIACAQKANPGMAELSAQPIGWDKIMQPMGNVATGARIAANVNYTPGRKRLIDLFSGWIKQSYSPFGRLPQASVNISPEKATSTEQFPVAAGVSMRMWVPAYVQGTKKITRAQPASAADIAIYANSIPGMEPASWFNTPSQFYFTMDVDPDGNFIDPQNLEKYAPVIKEVKSKVGNYLVYVTSQYVNIMLIPGNKLPVIPVSRKEALDIAEAGIKRANAKGDNPTYQMQEQLQTLEEMRRKYHDRMEEAARSRHIQYSMYLFDKSFNVFEAPVTYPICKVAPEVQKRCRTDQPQWITISFLIPRETSLPEKKIWAAMTENFNYDYVYNYFFHPEKVKGKSYQPRRPVSAN